MASSGTHQSSAVGLDLVRDVGPADGTLVKLCRAFKATAEVPAWNQRAVDLGVHAHLAWRQSQRTVRHQQSSQARIMSNTNHGCFEARQRITRQSQGKKQQQSRFLLAQMQETALESTC